MATTAPARNALARKSHAATTGRSDTSWEVGQRSARMRHARRSPTPHLTGQEFVRLLAHLDEVGGVTTIDGLSRALPRVSQPVSAVFDLCDAGILDVDWEAAFDGDMHLWRVDR